LCIQQLIKPGGDTVPGKINMPFDGSKIPGTATVKKWFGPYGETILTPTLCGIRSDKDSIFAETIKISGIISPCSSGIKRIQQGSYLFNLRTRCRIPFFF
jgi:hypothetical protein